MFVRFAEPSPGSDTESALGVSSAFPVPSTRATDSLVAIWQSRPFRALRQSGSCRKRHSHLPSCKELRMHRWRLIARWRNRDRRWRLLNRRPFIRIRPSRGVALRFGFPRLLSRASAWRSLGELHVSSPLQLDLARLTLRGALDCTSSVDGHEPTSSLSPDRLKAGAAPSVFLKYHHRPMIRSSTARAESACARSSAPEPMAFVPAVTPS